MVIESGCLVATQLIKACLEGGSGDAIVKEIVRAIRKLENCDIQFASKDCNGVADLIAKNCNKCDVDVRVLVSTCAKVRQLLMSDYPDFFNE